MRFHNREWWVSACAAMSVVVLHALFIAPLVLGAAARKRPVMPDMQGSGASALASSAEAPTAMTLIDLSKMQASEEPLLEDLASMGIELPKFSLLIASMDPNPSFTPLDEDAIEDDEMTEAAGDTQGRAKMFGRYIGQVSARIERAWMRPRSEIRAPRFSCQAKIEQDEQGRVLSTELRHCNGDARWQRSLVAAIEHASPLPAPPIPSVFSRMLVLDFSADPFQAGLSDERRYEPEARLALADALTPLEQVTNADKTLADVSQHEGAIYLRIEGNRTTWTLRDTQPSADRQNE